MAVLTLTLLACVVFCAEGQYAFNTIPDTIEYSYTRTYLGSSLRETASSVADGTRIWFSSIDGDLPDEGLSAANSIIDYSTSPEEAVVRVNGVCFLYSCDNPADFAAAVTVLEGRDSTTVTVINTVCLLDATVKGSLLTVDEKVALLDANPTLAKLCPFHSRIFRPTDATHDPAFPMNGAERDGETFLEVLTLSNKLEILVPDFAFRRQYTGYRYYPSYAYNYRYRG